LYTAGSLRKRLAQANGPLPPQETITSFHQLAQALHYAHTRPRPVIHRDIKPDNLMLNDQGIVKVADLGLVKTAGLAPIDDQPSGPRPGSGTGLSSLPSVTDVGVAMGTPAYMAPEQGRNAAAVDHRADIYSLGCTLYVMLTGRPPFQGKSALEVMTKHLTEPVVPPEHFVKRVPKELSAILLKMLAKKPDDRFADLSAVIAEFEKYLGVVSSGPFTPKEEHVTALDNAVKQFNGAPSAKQRAIAVPAFFGMIALLIFGCLVFRRPMWATGVIALGIMTVLGSFLTSGIVYRTHLFIKAREMVLASSWSDWLTWGITALLVLVALAAFGGWIIPILVALALVAAGICALYHIMIERNLVEDRAKAMAKAEKLLKTLRINGLPEEAVRGFVAKYSGDHWEEFYEALFGYDAMIQARQRFSMADTGKRMPHYAAWRDPIIQWFEQRPIKARERRERKMLQRIEQKQLEAQGVNQAEAKQRAAAAADVMVDAAATMKDRPRKKKRKGEAEEPRKPLFNAKQLLEAANKAAKDQNVRQ
ncbi:MAG: serine/threonine-protein kinase, partial [Candidatus Acidiferrum sp.]